MHTFANYFFYFVIYSFLGYICEVIYVAICTKKITNRGYLYGPLVPIYGFGAVGILLCLSFFYNMGSWYGPILVCILGFLLTTSLEYLTSFGMEAIFHMRWWDYSDKFMNINGRVCLRNSLMFAALVMAVLYLIHPYAVQPIITFLSNLGNGVFYTIGGVLSLAIFVDFVFSTIRHVNIAKLIKHLEAMANSVSQELSKTADAAKVKALEIKESASNKLTTLKEYLEDRKVAKQLSTINLKYPSMKIKSYTSKMKVSVSEFINKIKDRVQGE